MFNPALSEYPDEALLMGNMVIGYGEIEFLFGICAGLALEHRDVILRAYLTIKTESGRIEIANALSVESFRKLGFQNEYAETYGAVKFCLKLRNQYAHAQFGRIPNGGIMFANPDDAFSTGSFKPMWRGIKLELLQQQEAYFVYTRQLLLFLEDRVHVAVATLNQTPHMRQLTRQAPARIPQPTRHIDL